MAGGGKTTTQTQKLDPRSQAYVNQSRALASTGAQSLMDLDGSLFGPETMSIFDQAAPFLNPWFDQVINPVNQSFDNALERMRMATNDEARGAGAFSSGRHGVALGVGTGQIEQGRASVLGNLYNQGWQTALTQGMGYQAQQRAAERQAMMEPFLRSQMALQLRNAGLGPTGGTTTTKEKTDSNVWGQVAGLGLGIAGNLLMPGAGAALGPTLGSNLFGNALSGGLNPLASPGLQSTYPGNYSPLTMGGPFFGGY